MEPDLQNKIKETVVEILENSNMDETSEFKVRKSASEKLGIDLSRSDRKKFVRQIVESYLADQQSKADAQQQAEEVEEEEEEEENEEEEPKRKGGAKEYDDDGDLIICRPVRVLEDINSVISKLSEKRRVTITDFRGKTLVSMREYYRKDGKELPTSKGEGFGFTVRLQF
ncbi:hypothetical protein RJ640_019078 [Escallonia rubra]|uniref:DEK-C domain-containing protein n=1 Tax=Escallonia rubra TaxID=112253 RepID=A0AA88RLD1_9ASTE|nr:hypothetical protein RJ640_019078 [Escallonia rubra]